MGGEILQRQFGRRRIFAGPTGAILAILVLAGAALLTAWLEPAQPPIVGQARASDGDSFRLGEQRVRLLGLDAPELSQTCEKPDGQSWPCGRAARDRMAQLLRQGTVDCQPEDTDQYQRLLAYCTVGGADLGAIMVKEGLAISADSYWPEEQAARQARLGIWAGGFERPRNWRDDHPRGGGGFNLLSLIGF